MTLVWENPNASLKEKVQNLENNWLHRAKAEEILASNPSAPQKNLAIYKKLALSMEMFD